MLQLEQVEEPEPPSLQPLRTQQELRLQGKRKHELKLPLEPLKGPPPRPKPKLKLPLKLSQESKPQQEPQPKLRLQATQRLRLPQPDVFELLPALQPKPKPELKQQP